MAPAGAALSAAQIDRLAAIGEERAARAGDVLYRVGDRTYPFVAIREGEVAIVDESIVVGGQTGLSRRIENYLGFPAGITGNELTGRAVNQGSTKRCATAVGEGAMAVRCVHARLRALRITPAKAVNHE